MVIVFYNIIANTLLVERCEIYLDPMLILENSGPNNLLGKFTKFNIQDLLLYVGVKAALYLNTRLYGVLILLMKLVCADHTKVNAKLKKNLFFCDDIIVGVIRSVEISKHKNQHVILT